MSLEAQKQSQLGILYALMSFIIWAALAIYSLDLVRQHRKATATAQ